MGSSLGSRILQGKLIELALAKKASIVLSKPHGRVQFERNGKRTATAASAWLE